ncbi:MAG: hypothetical protein AAF583_11825 [Pseudomonadota bacterium]
MSQKEDQKAFASLIPELEFWNHGKGVDPESWIGMMGRYDLAIGYSLVFWPRFVEFEDYVLRKGFAVKSLRGFETQTNGDKTAVEAVMNHLHVAHLHINEDDPTEEQVRYLGRVLADIHKTKLESEFTDRNFKVVFNDESGLCLDEYELTFWQE